MIGLILACGGLTWFATGVVYRYAIKRQLLDIPNERSSHQHPTPRGGGVAIVICFSFGLLMLWSFAAISSPTLIAFMGSGIVIAMVGFIDDHGHIAARWRLLVHFMAAIWGVYWLGGLPSLSVMDMELQLGWIGEVLACLYIVWLLNLYNFMDGIDGVASVEAVTVCAGGFFLLWLSNGDSAQQIYVPVLIATTLGFLYWNFPPAKIFMGDGGSGFLGLMLGFFSLQAGHIQASLFWGWIILLGAFVVDASFTLIRRIIHGKKFYEAHRSHAYQYLSRRLGAHKPVALGFGVINLLWLLPIAGLVVSNILDGAVGVVLAYLPLMLMAYLCKAGDEAGQKKAERQ